jgi:DNA replication protein DnaD
MSTVRNFKVLGNDEERKRDVLELVEESAGYWEENLDVELREFHIKELISWYGVGFEHDLIKAVMIEAFRAPAPSWRYLAAIIRNLETEKVYTLDGFKKRGAQRSAQKEKRGNSGTGQRIKQVYAQMYKQREYTEAELEGDSIKKLMQSAKDYEKGGW